MGYITPDNVPNTKFCVRFFVPDDIYILAAFKGAILELTSPENWEQVGTKTPDEMAALFQTLYDDALKGSACMIGSLVHYVTVNPPSGVLACDGTQYLRVDYPNLYSALPASLIVDADNFITPTIQDTFLLASGTTYLPEDTGGETEHTLTVSEMPAHSHTYDKETYNVDVESVGVPDPTGVGLPAIPTQTSSTGDGNAHNNMPPFVAYKVGIVAR